MAGAPASASGGVPSVAGGEGGSAAIIGGAGPSGAGAPGTCTDTPPNNGDTCAHAVEYGWCNQAWLNGACARSCGTCSGPSSGSGGAASGGANGNRGGASSTNGGTTGNSGGNNAQGGKSSQGGFAGSVAQPPRVEGGTNGWASRYWDCCKPACGWKANVPGSSTPLSSCSAQNQSLGSDYDARNACEQGGSAHMCHGFSPWAVSDTLAYGFAAVNKGDFCGRCYQLQFTGTSNTAANDPGSQSLVGKTLIVQAINNGGVGSDQFDLLIPGGGVGDFDACSSQWGTTDLGERYGGFYLACQKQNNFDHARSKACAAAKCQSVFNGKPVLLEGCNWFLNWFNAPDNPQLVYKEVPCPEAITAKSGLRR